MKFMEIQKDINDVDINSDKSIKNKGNNSSIVKIVACICLTVCAITEMVITKKASFIPVLFLILFRSFN